MRHKLVMIVACILLAGCGKGGNESENSNAQKNTGMFSGALAGKEYIIDVNCSYYDQDYFQFLSDKTDVSDTNGDGIIISGMENKGKFVLTIIDDGKTFSAGSLSSFTKNDNKAEGSGSLYEEGTANAHEVQFSVTCG